MNDYTNYDIYNVFHNVVIGICKEIEAMANFDILVMAKNLVLLMEAPIGGKCQVTCFNFTVGISYILDDLYCVARVEMKMDTAMEIDLKSLFISTSAKYKPDFLDLMKLSL